MVVSRALGWAVLVGVVLAVVFAPGLRVVTLVVAGRAGAALGGEATVESWGPWLGALGRTVLVAALVALACVAVAWPIAWGLAGARRRADSSSTWRMGAWAGVLLGVPLLVPSYVSYAAITFFRGPSTWLGGLIEAGPAGLVAWVGQVTGIVGMVMWLWPLGVLLLVEGLRAVPAGAVEQLALERAPWWRMVWVRVGMARSAVVTALLGVGLVVLGSAVPLHLGQVQTYAIWLWRLMDLSPDPGRVWVAALPLVVVAGLAGWMVARRIARWSPEDVDLAGGWKQRPRWRWWAMAVWGVSVVGPLAAFAMSLRDADLLRRFWVESGAAVGDSALLAAAVGACGVVMALATWIVLGADAQRHPRRERLVAAVLGALVFSAVLPGVLVGAAQRAATDWWPAALADGWWPLVLAHVGRFGFLAVLAGMVLALGEPREHRMMRLHDGAATLGGLWRTRIRPGLGALAGLGLVMGALSIQEIEAAVVLQPPGMRSLPRVLLEQLHYLRDQQLAAAAINLTLVAGAAACLAGWLMSERRGGEGKASPH